MAYSIEKLTHFKCDACEKWWTIGDAPMDRSYYCPWCGVSQVIPGHKYNTPTTERPPAQDA